MSERERGLGQVQEAQAGWNGLRPWRLLRRDIGRKLTAIVLALLLWMYLAQVVSGDRILELDVRTVATAREADLLRFQAPAVYLVVPPELIVRDDLSRRKVGVRVRGLRDEIEGLELSAVLKMTPEAIGDEDEAEIPLTLDDRTLFDAKGGEPEFNEFEVDPPVLYLTLAQRAEAEFTLGPVNVSVSGRPKEGYTFEESRVRVQPNRVRLSGPRSAIEALEQDPSRFKLSPVDLEGRIFDVSQQVGIDREKVDRSVTMHTAGSVVEVTILIQARDISRELLSIPVHYKNQDTLALDRRRLVSSTSAVDLKVIGPRAVLEGLTNEQLVARIIVQFDWRGARLPQARERVRVFTDDLPDSIRVVGLDDRPPEIDYLLEDVDEPSMPAPVGDAP